MRTPVWISIAGVSIAAITAAIIYFKDDGNLSINGSNITSANNISSESGNVTIIQNPQNSERNIESLDSDQVTTHGAVDGKYNTSGSDGGDFIQINRNESFHFYGGNCTFDGKLTPSGRDLIAWVTETDGICEILEKIDKTKAAFRLSPDFGSRSNNGRFNEFYLASAQDALDVFTDKYIWYAWNE